MQWGSDGSWTWSGVNSSIREQPRSKKLCFPMCSIRWLFIDLGDVMISKNDPEVYIIWVKVYWQECFQTLKPGIMLSYRFDSQSRCCPLIRAAFIMSSFRCSPVVLNKTHWKHSLQIEKQLACWIVIITRSAESFFKIELLLYLIIGLLNWWCIIIDKPGFSFQPCHLYWMGN